MTPILYDKNCTDKIAFLSDAVKCIVTEARNGAYTLELEYPVAGKYFSELAETRIIKAKPNQTDDNQFFIISEISKPHSGLVTISGKHISYMLSGHPVKNLKMSSASASTVISSLLSISNTNYDVPHSFSLGSCDISALHSVDFKAVSVRAALGGIDNSVLDLFGGEYKFDNFKVSLLKNRGADNGVRIAYGKNLLSMKLTTNKDSTYTGIFPYVITDESYITLSENNGIIRVNNESGIEDKILSLDCSSLFPDDVEINATNLETVANQYLADNDINNINGSMTVEFVDLTKAKAFDVISALETVNLCDTVTVYNPKLNVSVKMKVIETVYNSLTESYEKLELGTPKASFSDVITQSTKTAEKAYKKASEGNAQLVEEFNEAIADATNAITGASGGRIVFIPPRNPQEMRLLIDTDDVETAKKYYIANSAGFGYTGNGGATFPTAILGPDGKIIINEVTSALITANLIRTGSILSADASTYFNLDGNELVISNYAKGSTISAGAYSTKLSSGLIEFSGATSNGALGRTGKIRTGYTKSGSTYTGKHFAIGYISNSSGEGSDGAHSMKLGAFDSKTDQFTTLMQLSGSEGVVVSEDTSITLSNKRNHFESNTLHNSNAEFVSGNSFSVGLKHFSVSKNNTTYAWRQHYFGSYIDNSYNHWTGWQAYNSNSEFEHSFSTLKMSDSTVGVRFAVGSSAAYLRVVTSGTPGVYFRKNYDTATDFSNAMNIYAGNGNFADVYVNSGLSSPVSVTGLHTRLVTLEGLGLSGLSSNVTANTNRCSDIYGILGSTKINGETHSMQLSRFKYLFGNGDTAGSNDVWRLIFKEYGTAARANIGCSATKNIGFYKGSDSSTYTNIYAANINSSSTQDCKKNISTASVDALSLVENSKIYNFDYKNEGDDETLETSSVIESDEDIGSDYGFVIERETPDEVLSDDGTAVNLYSMISLNWKATQQLLERVKALEGGNNNGH